MRNEFYPSYLLRNKQTKLKAVIKIILIAILLLIINRNDSPPWSRKIEVEMQKTTLTDSPSYKKYYMGFFKVLTKNWKVSMKIKANLTKLFVQVSKNKHLLVLLSRQWSLTFYNNNSDNNVSA